VRRRIASGVEAATSSGAELIGEEKRAEAATSSRVEAHERRSGASDVEHRLQQGRSSGRRQRRARAATGTELRAATRRITREEEEQSSAGGGEGVIAPYPRCHRVAAGSLLPTSRVAHAGALPLCGCTHASCSRQPKEKPVRQLVAGFSRVGHGGRRKR
jgi:hypothetical protein